MFDAYGESQVLVKAMSIDYYWAQLRTKGGAYGGGLIINSSYPLGLYSYRDPHIKESNETYLKSSDFIKSINYDDDSLLKLKIGAISDDNFVLHPSDAGRRGLTLALSGYTYKEALLNREKLLNCTSDDLKAYANDFDKLVKGSSLCVIGNAKMIEENKGLFTRIRNFTK